MEVALLCLVIFILTADQMALTGILQRPLVACALIGAVLGNAGQGVLIGSSLELLLMGYEQSYRFTEKGMSFVLYSAVACIFTIKSGMDTSTAVASAAIFAAIGTYVTYLFFNLNTVFIPMARKAAETRNETKLLISMLLPVMIAGVINCALTVAAYHAGDAAYDLFNNLSANTGWILNAMTAAGVLVPCVGFAVLLRNIGTKDIPGALAAGIACGALLSTYFYKGFGMVILVLAAFAAGSYDYHANKTASDHGSSMKGGAQKWW